MHRSPLPNSISQDALGKWKAVKGRRQSLRCKRSCWVRVSCFAKGMEGQVQRRQALYKGARTPPWKETFRQRCVERLKSSRARLLDRYRHVGEDTAHQASKALLVQEVMEMEWQALQPLDFQLPFPRKQETNPQVTAMLDVLEEIQEELILQEQLAVEEYEQSLRFDEECLNAMLDGLDAERKVICPVCRRNNLCVMSHSVVCPCGLSISTQGMTKEKLCSSLEDCVTEHSHRCQQWPEFAVTSWAEGKAHLLMSCQVCDSWAVIL
ncbi:RPA-interacting protein [Zootoca vivipara]|uniref:RPA-interacting protein n=1 Tax=Zootoca vivipara TaxID=8524 RepID=UPI0015929AB9|nr:RPA-interacting protein [Zootoca vivipara]